MQPGVSLRHAVPMHMIAFESLDRTGDAHAVAITSDNSLCGKQMLTFAGKAWPILQPVEMAACVPCCAAVYGEPA